MKKLSFGRIASLHGSLASDCCKAASEDGHALYGYPFAESIGLVSSVLPSIVVFQALRTAFQSLNFLGAVHVF